MNKAGFARSFFVFVGLSLVSVSAFAQRWTFSLGGAYIGGFKIGSAPYSATGSGTYVTLSDSGSISASPKKGNAGGSFGVMYSFSKSLGVRVRFAYLGATPVDLSTAYAFSWTFATTDNAGTYRIARQMANTGDLSAQIFDLDLVFTLAPGKTTFIHLSAGPSAVSAKLRLYSDLGRGISWSGLVDDVKWKFAGSSTWNRTTKSAAVVDYYLAKARSEEEKSASGFHFGLELEQKISSRLGIFLAASYCSIGESEETEALWTVDPPASFKGVFGNLDSSTPVDWTILLPFKSMVNFSHFAAVAGLKIHL
jgi:hypothetical protein